MAKQMSSRSIEVHEIVRVPIHNPISASHRARGVALVVVLVFITIMSLAAALSIRRAFFGEGVARGSLDIEVARQSAELALRDAELDLSLFPGNPPPGAVCARSEFERPGAQSSFPMDEFRANCLRGQCAFVPQATATTTVTWVTTALWNNNTVGKPSPGNAANCDTFTGGVPLGIFTGTPRATGVSRQPEYMIEAITDGDLQNGLGRLYSETTGRNLFRITARGFGLNPNTEIVLQSYLLFQ
jgi:type IV pilus assembly protein PilX